MFVLHTHANTSKKNSAHVHPQTQMKAEASMRQNTQRHRHSNSPPGFICINRGLLELCSRPAFQCLCFLFFCGLKQQLSRSCRSFSASVSLFPSLSLISFCHLRFSPSLLPCLITRDGKQKKCFPSVSSPLSLLHLSSLSFCSFSLLLPVFLTFLSQHSPYCLSQELPKLFHPCSTRRRTREGVSRRRARVSTDVGI